MFVTYKQETTYLAVLHRIPNTTVRTMDLRTLYATAAQISIAPIPVCFV